MQAIIYSRYILSSIFERYKVHEVYSDPDFSFADEYAKFYVLVRNMDNIVAIHKEVSTLYEQGGCFITKNPHDLMFEGKKIIYRDGAWYV